MNSGEWIRTTDLRVMGPSGSPGYPTPLRRYIYYLEVLLYLFQKALMGFHILKCTTLLSLKALLTSRDPET